MAEKKKRTSEAVDMAALRRMAKTVGDKHAISVKVMHKPKKAAKAAAKSKAKPKAKTNGKPAAKAKPKANGMPAAAKAGLAKYRQAAKSKTRNPSTSAKTK